MKKAILLALVFGVVASVQAETLCTDASQGTRIDLAAGSRRAAPVETLTFSTNWHGGESAVIAVDGETLADNLQGDGTVDWIAPSEGGLYTLTHTVVTGGVPVVETALFRVPYQVGDDAWADVDGGECTVFGTSDTWDFTSKDNPIDGLWASVTDVVVADGVTGLGSYTFYKFYNVTNMSVAASVTNLATGSIYLCHSLESVSFLGATMPTTAANVLNLKAGIVMDGDTPVVTLVPKVTVGGKAPTLMGTNDLTDKDSWVTVTMENVKQYHFFKYVVQ